MGFAGKSGARSGPPARRGSQARTLRIIGGAWRGRKWRFPAGADIRPTPDRVRETLFNWLGGRTQGARCLDLFAGSGALGLEALSRGAAQVCFVDSCEAAVRELRLRLSEWQAADARVECRDALAFLKGGGEPCDIVFLDPPFAAGLLAQAAGGLTQHGWLRRGALVYVECAAAEQLPPLPQSWQALKAKRAGEVGYHLFTFSGAQVVSQA
ncbi:MAG TPA: 16S rRNA (guanine(966)-N(2))-methyltransferase RsmD [Steroidobacteraceae bacterium]